MLGAGPTVGGWLRPGVFPVFPWSEYRIALPRHGPQHRRSARVRHLPPAPGEWQRARPDRGASKPIHPAWFVAGVPVATWDESGSTATIRVEHRRRTTRPEPL